MTSSALMRLVNGKKTPGRDLVDFKPRIVRKNALERFEFGGAGRLLHHSGVCGAVRGDSEAWLARPKSSKVSLARVFY